MFGQATTEKGAVDVVVERVRPAGAFAERPRGVVLEPAGGSPAIGDGPEGGVGDAGGQFAAHRPPCR